MSTWNDDRLDELSWRTDEGFKEVRQEVKEVRQEVKDLRQEMNEGLARVDKEMADGFARVDARFDRMNNTLIVVGGGIIATLLGSGIFG